MKCIYCNKTNTIEKEVCISTGSTTKIWVKITARKALTVKAHVCTDCGMVMPFVNPEQLQMLLNEWD